MSIGDSHCVCGEVWEPFGSHETHYYFPMFNKRNGKVACVRCGPNLKQTIRPTHLPKNYTFYCLYQEEESNKDEYSGYIFETFQELENHVLGNKITTLLTLSSPLSKELINLVMGYYNGPYYSFGILRVRLNNLKGIRIKGLRRKIHEYSHRSYKDWNNFTKKVHHVNHRLIKWEQDTTWRERKLGLNQRLKQYQYQLLKLEETRQHLYQSISSVTKRIQQGEESCESDASDSASD